jgi:beta-galactosidase
LIIHPRPDQLEMLIQNTRLRFHTGTGFLESLEAGEVPLLQGPLRPNFYRALDNDFLAEQLLPGLGRFWTLNRKWDESRVNLKLTDFDVQRAEDGCVTISTSYQLRQSRTPLRIEYDFDLGGGMNVRCSLVPRWEMLRFGFQVPMNKSLSETVWFGKGPHETMPDRKTGGRIGIHHLPSKRIHHDYIHPQENGNRSEVRWVKFTDQHGQGFTIAPLDDQLLNFSIWPYSQEDLLEAKHISDLPERDFYTLNIDLAQRGVGDLFSLMYGRDPETRLPAGQQYQLGFRIELVS